MELKVSITKRLRDQIRSDNELAHDMSDDELNDCVECFLNEIQTPKGLSLILENLDYFNW